MEQPLLFRWGWGGWSCLVIQLRVFVAAWGYLVVLGQKRGMMCSAGMQGWKQCLCWGTSPSLWGVHCWTETNAEKPFWSILCLFTRICFALEIGTIYSLKNGRFAFFSLHEHWSRVCESAKGALVGIERAIKMLILSSRPLKYSDQTSNCMSCYDNVNQWNQPLTNWPAAYLRVWHSFHPRPWERACSCGLWA